MMRLLLATLTATSTLAWSPANVPKTTMTTTSRSNFLQQSLVAATALVVLPTTSHAATTLASGVSYEIKETGKGPQPDTGELVAIRFAAYYGDLKIDDIYDTPEPYYTRVGSGGLLPGVEQVLPLMRLGDRWVLTIPVRCSLCVDGEGRLIAFCCLLSLGFFRRSSFANLVFLSHTPQSDMAFGSKGRKASAGKPRIPGGATIVFDVAMVGLPGKEPELIDLIGDV